MFKSTRIYLIRHGQVAGFEERRYNGQTDVPLTEKGLSQYRLLKKRLADKAITACYSSDLSRCCIGAKLISEQFGVVPQLHCELRELSVGVWEGMSWQEIQERWPQEWQNRLQDLVHHRVTGGENLLDLEKRVMPLVQSVVQQHQGEELLMVAHGGVNRLILLSAIGAPLSCMFHIEQDYGCLNIIDYLPEGRATVKLLNG